ncbi:MAG: N-acetylmuramoyl-L-alanine amidase [Fusobacteriaceae bacterium]
MKKNFYKIIIILFVVQIFILFHFILKKEIEEPIFKIDAKTHRATGYDHRIKGVVLHYTTLNNADSLRVLTKQKVSSHYLITDLNSDPIYSLVDDDKRAWHAGKSFFMERNNLNDTTIGIEIVNPGSQTSKGEEPNFVPYTEVQIEKVAFLLKDLIEKHDIEPKMILGHQDIAPDRKQDPGPLFPWKYLYEHHGIGAWYDDVDKIYFMNQEEFNKISIIDIKKEFQKYGYSIPKTEVWGDKSIQTIRAFQAHFRPENISGEVDLETYAILKALNKKYE